MSSSPYNFYIHPSVITKMYTCMMDGNMDQFMEDDQHIQGAERGGHFCYRKDNVNFTVEIIDFIQSELMPGTTSLNSGDFPFTFHTHPIVVNLDENLVDNYPNLISGEDLIGSVVDNYFCNFLDERDICNKSGDQNIGGISFFDILAAPYGLFVYRPDPNYHHANKTVDTIENECNDIFVRSVKILTNNYTVANKNNYFNTNTQIAQTRIKKYITFLSNNGFLIDFIPWEYATANGIQFVNQLPVHPYVDELCMC